METLASRTTSDVPYSHELAWPESLGPFEAQDFEVQKDPFAHYAWMRKHAPVLRTKTPGADVWFISRFADVQAALRAHKVFSSVVVDPPPLVFLTLLDPPDQTRLRQVVAATFTPKAVARLEDQIRHFANQYVDALVDAGGGDAVDAVALRLTMATISGLLGVPASDFEQMKAWSDDMSSYFGRVARNAPGSATDEQGAQDFFAYIKATLERSAGTSEETVSAHIGRLWKQGVLTEREATHFCAFLFVAGHETTTVLIANAFVQMAEQPDLLARLRAQPADAPRFVEEIARYKGTVQRLSRITREAVEVAGVTIPAQSFVKLLPGSANRDEDRFPHADRFDMDRDTAGHVGFGHGIHSCLGAHLARLEGRIATEVIAARIGHLELDAAKPPVYVVGGNMANSGPSALHVKVRPV
ncbi:cytochrome P450 [Hydrogenophaga sp.]|uniref:cytochrome P450 n=1 Tax=Hydrogenophaga sp. TaxID=1904254 RepID=UPI002610AC70|nr:cytochrome P450 [Hydrogenophaga sp.]MCW5653023.1 cytochrome P450 [Hydrogenophaga sp.]